MNRNSVVVSHKHRKQFGVIVRVAWQLKQAIWVQSSGQISDFFGKFYFVEFI